MSHDSRIIALRRREQAVLCLHCIRAAQMHARTSLINQVRGLLTEFEVVMPKGRSDLGTWKHPVRPVIRAS
jgi:hypothetical protein